MIEEIYLVKFFCLLQALPPGQEGQSHNVLTKDYTSVDCDSHQNSIFKFCAGTVDFMLE